MRPGRRLALTHGGACGPAWLRAGAFDRALLRRWTQQRPRPVGELLVTLSRAADRSALWLALAAAGASFGGERGRRAAQHGVLALAFTSATVNGPFKLLVGRRRPATRRPRLRTPRTSSFPSGHSASAFAFAVAATRELPVSGVLLLPLAAGVAYSRVYLGVHYPSDVAAGAAFGAAAGLAARSGARTLGVPGGEVRPAPAPPLPREAVLVASPRAGRSRALPRARRELDRHGIAVAAHIDIQSVDRLPDLLRTAAGEPRLVIAAGGDGTVGSVASRLLGTDNVLGILPLGTGNDFARSLGVPISPRRAAALLASGTVSSVDLGRLTRPGQDPSYFVHAATVGLNVDFAKLATRGSVRARLGRLTYLVASVYALRERAQFTCVLEHDGVAEERTLVQLSVISAPVIGGALGLSVRGPRRDDHLLDVLAIEDVPPLQMLRAGVFLLLGIRRPVSGIHALHVDALGIGSERPLGLALDGELAGSLPGTFEPVAGALRVVTGRRSSAGASGDADQQHGHDPAEKDAVERAGSAD
jgi:diacylglycerol kinase family enzyme/membrane-associated phospholipid phosphatase